jgi:transcriptional regulator with XRE-family HTH domain
MSGITEIADIVKRKREKAGWSQEQLAKRAGVNQANISNLEASRYKDISLSTLRGLAKAFRCQVIDLLPEQDKEACYSDPPADELSIYGLYEKFKTLEARIEHLEGRQAIERIETT